MAITLCFLKLIYPVNLGNTYRLNMFFFLYFITPEFAKILKTAKLTANIEQIMEKKFFQLPFPSIGFYAVSYSVLYKIN